MDPTKQEGSSRMFGADAPERGHPCCNSATTNLRGILRLGDGRVQLEAGSRAKDTSGRTVAYVWIDADGKRHLVDEALVQVGEAETWRRDGQHRERIIAPGVEPQEKGKGCLWR